MEPADEAERLTFTIIAFEYANRTINTNQTIECTIGGSRCNIFVIDMCNCSGNHTLRIKPTREVKGVRIGRVKGDRAPCTLTAPRVLSLT